MSETASEGATSLRPKPVDFIRENLELLPVPAFPAIRLYTPHPGSGLWRLVDGPAAPYWAYQWGGGSVLVRYLQDHPELVSGRRVLDLGAGSGIVGIAAAQAGALQVQVSEVDPIARVALALNAEANGVRFDPISGDLTAGPAPEVDVVLVGDLFYARDLARKVSKFLTRCREAGIEVVVGDPFRAHLPLARLRLLTRYPVADFGDAKGSSGTESGVFAFA